MNIKSSHFVKNLICYNDTLLFVNLLTIDKEGTLKLWARRKDRDKDLTPTVDYWSFFSIYFLDSNQKQKMMREREREREICANGPRTWESHASKEKCQRRERYMLLLMGNAKTKALRSWYLLIKIYKVVTCPLICWLGSLKSGEKQF